MALDASMGHAGTVSIAATPMPVLSDTVKKIGTHVEREGLRGTRSHDVDDVRVGPYEVAGTIVLNPTSAELDFLYTYILGTGKVLTEELPPFALISDRVAAVHTFQGCKVDRATLRGTAGALLELVLEVVGISEEVSGSAPAEPTSALPFLMSDCVLTLGGSAREVDRFELTVDNRLVRGRFMNGLVVTDIPEGDRIITLATNHDYNAANLALYEQALAGAAGTLVINDGTANHSIALAKCQVPAESPVLEGKGPIALPLMMTVRKDGATLELVPTVT